jgi:hypothetical protein
MATRTIQATEVSEFCREPTKDPRFRALFAYAQAADQQFWVGGLSFMGAIYGDLRSACVRSICRIARRERPARCTFAAEVPTRVAVHRAALGVPYAVALINVEPIAGSRLRSRTNHDLADIDALWLFERVGDRLGDGVGSHRDGRDLFAHPWVCYELGDGRP